MRVTDQSFVLRFLQGIAASRQRSLDALETLGDGKRVRTASDDPASASESLALRTRLARLAGLDRSAQTARTDLSSIDSILGEVVEVLLEARDEAMAGASNATDDVNVIRANVIDVLRERLLHLANTEVSGRFLFAGTETLTSPFATDGSYAGNGDEVQAPVDSNERIGATLSGERVFRDGGDLFVLFDDLSQALRDNDTDAISALVPSFTEALDHIGRVRADVGTRIQRIDQALERHDDEALALAGRVAQLEDADLAEVIVQLTEAESNSAALLAATAKVLGRSLFDYIA